ncbi:MAG TPA: AAA family ATPase [Candidatus Fimivivens sp.]|nr:AAA family ATPase [Candidatus Fimivivens sp.]
MNIIGHKEKRALLRKIASGVLPHHAYLFSGPEGVGKILVAREFAAALLGCPDGDPSRKQDFLLIVPEAKKDGGKRSIPVEAVREAGLFLSRYPAESSRRVVVIDDADRMTEAAQNALLKTLEEPNSTSVLILVSARTGALRDTVVSRMFRVPFTHVSEEDLRFGISVIAPDGHATVEPFFFSLGRPGIVASALSDPEAFSRHRDLLRSLFKISSLSYAELLALSEKLSQSPVEAADLFEWWVSGLRNMRKPGESRRATVRFYGLLEEIEKTIRMMRDTNANARLLIDRLFLVSL